VPAATSSKTAAQIARELRDAAWSLDPPAERLTLIELAELLDPTPTRHLPGPLDEAVIDEDAPGPFDPTPYL
jgi:hypothetical protein